MTQLFSGSRKEAIGISITGSTSIFGNPNVTSAVFSPELYYDQTLASQFNSYAHTIKASGGYWDARLSINMTVEEALSWLNHGLGRVITTRNEVGTIIWQGFANQIDVTVGGLSTSVGPLNKLTNMTTMTFTTRRENTNPPIGGSSKVIGRDKTNPTDLGDPLLRNDESLVQYGTWETNISAGADKAQIALDRANRWLNSNAWPESSKTLKIGSTSPVSVTIACVGWVHLLQRFMYADLTVGTLNPHEIIGNVLAADVDAIPWNTFNVDDSNALDIPRYEDGQRDAYSVINAVVAIGDGAGGRSIFGVLEDFSAYYNPIPTTAKYIHQISEPNQPIYDDNNALTKPWDVLPGNWLRIKGLSLEPEQELAQDPNAIFIESVNFTAPFSLSLAGGRSDSIDELLSAQGLGSSN